MFIENLSLPQASDLPSLNERLRMVAGWSVTDPNYLTMVDNNRVFLECLIDQVKAERGERRLMKN